MMRDESPDDGSGNVMGMVTLEGEPSDALLSRVMISTLESEDNLLHGCTSGML
jgi:hypothetical protein